jgi:hypothetical protein
MRKSTLNAAFAVAAALLSTHTAYADDALYKSFGGKKVEWSA